MRLVVHGGGEGARNGAQDGTIRCGRVRGICLWLSRPRSLYAGMPSQVSQPDSTLYAYPEYWAGNLTNCEWIQGPCDRPFSGDECLFYRVRCLASLCVVLGDLQSGRSVSPSALHARLPASPSALAHPTTPIISAITSRACSR